LDALFLHPNFPGQFKHIAAALAREPETRVWALGDQTQSSADRTPPGVRLLQYPGIPPSPEATHPLARNFEQAVRRAEQAIQALTQYKRQGLEPDVIVAHPGWGDAFFVRDYFPGAKVVGLFEYYYRAHGADVGFDTEFPAQFSDIFRLHAANATQLLALESCDVALCSTAWQKSRFPDAYQSRLQVQHEGIDTAALAPDATARITLPDGTTLQQGDEVVTYVSRSLEPYRGFHVFLRALPALLAARPHCQVVVVGSEGASYGPHPPQGGSWKDHYLGELGQPLDASRVHFTGALPYEQYVRVLQISRVHLYLTYPFILSWSLIEAMSVGCTIVASDTAPVHEVLQDGVNARLFPFKDHRTLAALAAQALAQPAAHAFLGRAARATARQRFDFDTLAWPAYRALLQP